MDSTAALGQGIVVTLRNIPNGEVELNDIEISASGLGAQRLRGRWTGSESGVVHITADGRFVIWYLTPPSGLQELFVFDRATGLAQSLAGIEPGGGDVVVDPSRPRLFVSRQELGRYVVLEPGGMRLLDLGAQWIIKQVSADGAVLFTYRCEQLVPPVPPYRVCTFARRDASTGAILSQAVLPADVGHLAMGPSEGELFVITESPGTFPRNTAMRRLDAITGVETGSIPVPVRPFDSVGGPGALIVHDGGQRFTVPLADGYPPYTGALWTVDTSASPWTEVALVPTVAFPRLAASSGAPLFVATSHPFRLLDRLCDAGTMDLVSPLTGTVVEGLTLAAGGCVRTAFAWVQPPGALSATVARNVVSLSWVRSPSPGVEHVVEAGSAPGLSDLARLGVPAGGTSLTVPNVPGGTYYVRVRAQNASGISDSSNEIVVSVPEWIQPPGALSATVAGNVVSLSWLPSPSSGVQYVVEAGSAPGLSNLARLAVPAGSTSLTVPDVPAGTYFVRVRAQNATGTSTTSNEIVVNVP